jgi:catechol 2,3-dioxygenase-like lactoylglutathione lyase family enzyme
MGIGSLRCAVVDVNDLEVAEAFWSEVTGMPVIPSVFPGRYSYLGEPDPWRHRLILHLVRTEKDVETNRAHVDIWVRDVSVAVAQVEAIGGRLKRAPTIYPRPGTFPEPPTLDWAVMQDPFGNEFCVISVLTPEESAAVAHATPGDDEHYRAAAGRAHTEES